MKGFSLKRSDVGSLIHYDAIKKLVEDRYHHNVETKIKTSQSMITRIKPQALLKTVEQSKVLRVNYTKGDVVIHENGTVETLPFGYFGK